MGLYQEWVETAASLAKTTGETGFWQEYSKIEKKMYSKLLSEKITMINGKITELAKKFDVSDEYFMGFLDGINTSLKQQLEIENIERDSEVNAEVDFEKLYFNMLEAKADYLYQLPQWDDILSDEKKREIHEQWKNTKTVVIDNKVGRNDLCPCGSGKKYKKCCGR